MHACTGPMHARSTGPMHARSHHGDVNKYTVTIGEWEVGLDMKHGWYRMLGVLIKINIITLLMSCPSQKRSQGDLRAVVQQRTAQWLPRLDEDPPTGYSPGRVTHLSIFPRQDLSGQGRKIV